MGLTASKMCSLTTVVCLSKRFMLVRIQEKQTLVLHFSPYPIAASDVVLVSDTMPINLVIDSHKPHLWRVTSDEVYLKCK